MDNIRPSDQSGFPVEERDIKVSVQDFLPINSM